MATPSRGRLCPPIEWRAAPTATLRPEASAAFNSARNLSTRPSRGELLRRACLATGGRVEPAGVVHDASRLGARATRERVQTDRPRPRPRPRRHRRSAARPAGGRFFHGYHDGQPRGGGVANGPIRAAVQGFLLSNARLLVAAPAPRGQGGIDPRRGQPEICRDLVAKSGDAGPRCTKTSAARSGNRDKECPGDPFSDRTSADIARQLRIWFAYSPTFSGAVSTHRGLAHTEFTDATCGSIRLKPMKPTVGKDQRETNKFSLASACPHANEWRLAAARLATRSSGLTRRRCAKPRRQPQTLRRRHTSPEPNAQNAQ